MDALLALLRRWPYSAPATFVGLMWVAYGWSIWMSGGLQMGSGLGMGGLQSTGYYLTGSLFTPSVTFDHEWERLVSGIFLHAGFLHIFMNSAAILQMGRILEMFANRGRCWFTLLTSGLAGSLVTLGWAHVTGDPQNSVGASGAGCGVGAALIVLSRGIPSLEEFRKQMITWVGVMLAMGLLPMISGTGHLGGAAGGLLAGRLVARRGTVDVRNDRYARGLDVATIVLAIVFVAALALNAVRTLERRDGIKALSVAADEIEEWLDHGSVTGLAEWRAKIDALDLPLVIDGDRRRLVAIAQWLAFGGGPITPAMVETARAKLADFAWW